MRSMYPESGVHVHWIRDLEMHLTNIWNSYLADQSHPRSLAVSVAWCTGLTKFSFVASEALWKEIANIAPNTSLVKNLIFLLFVGEYLWFRLSQYFWEKLISLVYTHRYTDVEENSWTSFWEVDAARESRWRNNFSRVAPRPAVAATYWEAREGPQTFCNSFEYFGRTPSGVITSELRLLHPSWYIT